MKSKRERERSKSKRGANAGALFRDNALVLSSQLHSAAIIFPALFPSSLLPSSIVPRKNTFAHNETDWVRTTRNTPSAHRQPAEHQRRSISLQLSLVENRHCCCWELLYLYVVCARERSRLLSARHCACVLCAPRLQKCAPVVAICADVLLAACTLLAICSIKFHSSAAAARAPILHCCVRHLEMQQHGNHWHIYSRKCVSRFSQKLVW